MNDINHGRLHNDDNDELGEAIQEEIIQNRFALGDAEDEDAFEEEDFNQDPHRVALRPEDLNSQRSYESLDESSESDGIDTWSVGEEGTSVLKRGPDRGLFPPDPKKAFT